MCHLYRHPIGCLTQKQVDWWKGSTTVSIFVDIVVELTNTVFVNSTNTSTNIETVMLSTDNLVKLKELKLTIDKTFLRTRLVWWHWVPGCPWQRRTGWKESLSPFMSCKQRYWVERKLNLFMSCYHRSNLQSVGEEDGDAEHGQGCLCQWSTLWHHLLKREERTSRYSRQRFYILV